MGAGGPSNYFLIAGVVLNVVVTALAIWWLLKQGVRKLPPPPAEREPDAGTGEPRVEGQSAGLQMPKPPRRPGES